MLDFNIDIADVVQEFTLSNEQIDSAIAYCVQEVTVEVYRAWSTEAKQNLGSSRNQYISSLGVEKVDDTTSIIYLDPGPWLPNAIESGYSAFDMKPGFLASSRVKHTKEGQPYLTIAFRFATPGSLGESDVFAGVLPTSIHQIVRQQQPIPSNRNQGLSLGSIPQEFQIPKSMELRNTLRSAGYESLVGKEPMTSIYEGLQRTSGGYVNFRRVSLASDADRWQHPGITARNFASIAEHKIESKIPDIVDRALDNYLASVGF